MMGNDHDPAAAPDPPLHRTKAAVRDMADHLYRSSPITLSGTEYAKVLDALQESSGAFVAGAIRQTQQRAKVLYETEDPTPQQCIKAVFAHRSFGRTKSKILDDAAAMDMIDRSLASEDPVVRLFCTGFPMKVANPLETECRSDAVDLGDVSVLLRYAELAAVLTHFGQPIGKAFAVTVISDGRMNDGMFKTESLACESYVSRLGDMTARLAIDEYVSVTEFYSMLAEAGADHRVAYDRAVEAARTHCHDVFGPLLDRGDLDQSLKQALDRENDLFDTANFADLFHSSIGSIHYPEIRQLAHEFTLEFAVVYTLIVGSILWGQRIEDTRVNDVIMRALPAPARSNFQYRAQKEQAAVAEKAWHSTIEYFAVMEAARTTDILNTIVPGGIRVTTRPKQGQIGVHTSDQNSPSLFSYHSVPVIVLCDKGKRVKVDFQLRLHALTGGYRPVLLHGTDTVAYVHPDVPLELLDALPWRRGG
ncbi:hypothetical protein [Glycomyces sp. MUSA5-2]|uniref:hypothetical protein n=1 Tax=Glycomyces sp. MUSA5-2 TaxID=2053002 RepID=UPI00300A53D7